MRIYIGFLAMGILIVTGMLFMRTNGELRARGSELLAPIVPTEIIGAKILFGGDMMFDRTVRKAIEQKGGDFIFSCLNQVFAEADVVVANLEGPITDNESLSRNTVPGDGHNVTFTFATSTASLLYAHNIRIVNVGNNHIMNFGREGLLQTEKYLDAAGVLHFGDPDKSESERLVRTDIGGVSFSFINWSDWTSDNTDVTAAQVRVEHELGRVVVVYTHWGEEYLPATERQKRLARAFVDEGADIVIGSHPHVVQEHEIYKGKHIYYSLGNLIFDQYFDEAVMRGLMVQVEFGPAGVVEVKEIPVELKRDRRTCPVKS